MILDKDQHPQTPEEEVYFQREVLWACLSGSMTPQAVCKKLGLDPLKWSLYVTNVINKMHFQTMLVDARRDMIVSVQERLKQNLHLYIEQAEKIALSGEERNQVAMLKDLLDRAGTGATQKVSVQTPTEYKRRMEEMLAPPAEDK